MNELSLNNPHTRLLSCDMLTLKVHYPQTPAAMEQDLSNPSERNLTVNRRDIILYILRGNFTAGKAMSIFVKEKSVLLNVQLVFF